MRISRLFNNIRRLIKVFQNRKYAVCPDSETLDRRHFTALNVGAVVAEQNMYYCNCLETEPDKKDVKYRISDYYGIIDRETALETLEWLYHRGDSVFFEAIKPLISNVSSEINTDALTALEKDRPLGTYINNIKETLGLLIQHQIIQNGREFSKVSIKAWDFGRLVLVVRCCFDVRYITQEEAWSYILNTHEQCKTLYSSWKDFAAGYLVGRCMWSGEDSSLYGIFDIVDSLLKDVQSPWHQYPLH